MYDNISVTCIIKLGNYFYAYDAIKVISSVLFTCDNNDIAEFADE